MNETTFKFVPQKLFPGVNFRTLAATFCFYMPVYRELLLYGGQ
jgi:2-acylglycerol O-acyltransferase 2